jgi:uncharacterized protein YcbK (DUF882 family)
MRARLLPIGGISRGHLVRFRSGHDHIAKKRANRAFLAFVGVVAGLLAGTARTQDAAAFGETRSLTFFHTHTRESATITFRRNGEYDEEALNQLNWLLRDWRVEQPAKMDRRLFDILWEVYRETGSSAPINVISAYRSPTTNAMLRNRSKAVSEHSQHMLGRAMDVRFPDVDTSKLREIAMKMQYGGVGYYPSSSFVHIDTGSVRAWPRMSEEQLARLFPDGKTVHLPPSGKPLARYEEARAEIAARDVALASGATSGPSLGSLLAGLFRRDQGAQPTSDAEAAPPQPRQVTLASAAGAALPEALTFMPLPPRRPAIAPPAPVDAASEISAPVPQDVADAAAESADSADPGEFVVAALTQPTGTPTGQGSPVPEDRSDASRLLFAPEPVHAIPGAGAAGKAYRADSGQFLPVALVVDAGAALLDIRFTHQAASGPNPAHFAGPAIEPLPVVSRLHAQL